jgi:translocation and assembly module TamA
MRQVYQHLQTLLIAMAAVLLPVAAQAEVTLRGLDKTQTVNVRSYLRLSDTPCDTPPWQVRRLSAKAPAQIAAALEALGYYRSNIEISDGETRKNCWHKLIVVDPGPPTLFRDASVTLLGEGASDPVLAKLVAEHPLRDGVRVNHGVYARFKQGLASRATQRGFFDATFKASSVTVHSDLATAKAVITLDTGPRYRFGEVTVDSDLLTKELFGVLTQIKAGSFYNSADITATHRNFLESGYFGFVNVVADPRQAQDLSVPVKIELSGAKTRIYTGGVGFATDVGPRFRLNYRNRRINPRGHTLNGQLIASPVQSVLGTEYRIPIGDDRRDVFVLSSTLEDQDTDTSEFTSFELGARRTIALDSGWLRTQFVDLRREDFKVGDQDESSTLLIPGMSWWRGSDIAQARPDNAYRVALDVRGTSEAIGSDTSFVQVEAKGRLIRSLSQRSRLLARLHVGATAKKSRSELPPSLRFFAGGDNSVRGYNYESIGSLDDNGLVVGGGRLVTASIELDWRLNERWALAVFADTGSAFDDGGPDFKTGVGVGIRRITPVGPVRIDLAAPLDRERKVRLHFSIGSYL